MTSFEDGPAAGKTLSLRRAPQFLRVVVDGKGNVDALDQLHDTPAELEAIYVYTCSSYRGVAHVKFRKGGGFFAMATYRLAPEQPSDAEARDTNLWQQWCEAQWAKRNEGGAK